MILYPSQIFIIKMTNGFQSFEIKFDLLSLSHVAQCCTIKRRDIFSMQTQVADIPTRKAKSSRAGKTMKQGDCVEEGKADNRVQSVMVR